jgi:hypothetical protein
MPVRPNSQLTKRDLGTYDFKLLNAIEAVANSAPYLGNEVYRNDLILDNELRTSTALTCFFLDGEVAELQPGFNLLTFNLLPHYRPSDRALSAEDKLQSRLPLFAWSTAPTNDNHYDLRSARTVAILLGCEGCGRRGCFSTRHPNWNTQHATVKWKDTVVVREIRHLANGKLRSLSPDGVQWLPEDNVWIGEEQLNAWKAKI